MDIIQTLAQQLNLTAEQVGKTVQLIDEGNTICRPAFRQCRTLCGIAFHNHEN